ncbi:unnamed protein product [Urochloa humidicola]
MISTVWLLLLPNTIIGRPDDALMSLMQRARRTATGSQVPEELIGAGLAGNGAAAWPVRMRLLLPVKLSVHSHQYLNWCGKQVRERCHWIALLLWVLGWSLFSMWILSFLSSQAVEMRQEELASMCDERARILEDKVKVAMNQLKALAVLLSTFHHSRSPSAIDQTIFARYLERTAFQRPLMSGLAYAVRVTHAEREPFEQLQAWSIKKMYSSKKQAGDPDVREPAEEYAPVIFAQNAYKHVVSFDMFSGNEDRENVLRARESGKCILSAPFKLLNNHIGVILTYAVYKSELPPNATAQYRIQSAIGYLGGIFDIEAHVDELLQNLAGKGSIIVNVYDTTNERPISMYGWNNDTGRDTCRPSTLTPVISGRPTESLITMMNGWNDTGSVMCHVSTLNFGDPYRRHDMHCRFTQRQPWPWLAITSSYGTLVVSLLVGIIFHITGKRVAKVQRAVYAIQETHEPFEREQLYREDVRFSPRSLELSQLAIHNHDLQGLQDEELNEAERNLKELGTWSKFIAIFKELTSIHNLSSPCCYMNKKVVSISLLGFLLFFIVNGAFDQSFNRHSDLRRGNHNTILDNFGWSRGRLLIASLHGTWVKRGAQGSDIIRVDLRKMTGSRNDSSGQQKHWFSHNSSEIPAVLYVTRNGKQVKIHCNLIADKKALANWISNGNTDLSSKYREDTAERQNGTVNPYLPAHKSHKTTVGPWIALVSVFMLVLGIVVWLMLWCKHRKGVQQKELELFGGIMGPRGFQLHELATATSNFSEEKKLGRGGFGPVYRGYLSGQDLHVAIKVLSKHQTSQDQSEQGLREFKAEVKVMTQLRHRNIVKLVGWCDSKERLLLVYELMAQGSLDKHLYDPEKILTWQQRFKIVLDLGSGLLYLHRDCEKCIVHGDIKPANVMLDASHNAKLGDFGLARLVEHGGEPQTTQVVAGTPGYIDPEFINNRWPRTEMDVYSFGVVLLEIACGKRPVSRQPNGASSLLSWVHGLYDQGMFLDAADQKLNGEFDRRQMERVIVTGLWCAHQDPMQRPSIVQAMDVLRSAGAELPVIIPAMRDARHIRSLEEQVYADLPAEDRSVHAVNPSAYFTSKDSVYLLADE